ncbi:transporter [bacterium]|nr:transporter [bacterium]
MKPQHALLLVFTLLTLLISGQAKADSRHFGYLYEADSVLEKGKWEFEQWLTFRTGKGSGNYYRFDIREEVEVGLTDRLTTALYLNLKSESSDGVSFLPDEEAFKFEGVSSEWKYMISSPNLHPVGLLLYFEPTYSGRELELEEKIVLQHNFGENWILTYNFVMEHEWEFESSGTAKEMAIENNLGLAYKINPNWSVGIEGRAVSVIGNFDDYEHTAFFAGPSVHYEKGRGWATLAVQPQLTTDKGHRLFDDHEAVEVRAIVGFYF